MYTILENTEFLTFEEIKKKYDGKWVFMTNCEFSPGNKPLRAIPRVIADKKLEGFSDGIYEVYKNRVLFGETTDVSLYDRGSLMRAITFLPKGGNADEANNVLV